MAWNHKRLWTVAAVVIAATSVCLAMRLQYPDAIEVRIIGRTNDYTGQVHVYYQIVNWTTNSMIFGLAGVETRTGSGWQKASSQAAQPELRVNRVLFGLSALTVHVLAPPEGSAVRAVLEFERPDGALQVKLRSLGRRLGLPRRIVEPGPSVFNTGGGVPYRSLRLPPLETPGGPFYLAAEPPSLPPEPTVGNLVIRRQAARVVLRMYQTICGSELAVDVAPAVLDRPVTVYPGRNVTEAEAPELIAAALREQAGIILMRKDSNHVTATYETSQAARTKRPGL
jgi:hypothetical protein